MGEGFETQAQEDWEDLRRAFTILARNYKVLLLVTLLVAAVTVVSTATKQPEYAATAVVLVEDDKETRRLLLEENTPAPDPASLAREAASILDSFSIAELVAARPEDGGVPAPGHPEHPLRLGLDTLVHDESRTPLRTFLRRFTGPGGEPMRLHALADRVDPAAPWTVRVRFLSGDRVAVTLPGSVPGTDWMDRQREVFEWRRGVPIEYHGLSLRLEHSGPVDTTKSFLVEHLKPLSAVKRAMAQTSVFAPKDGGGTVRITVKDADAGRAAAIANSMVANYMETLAGRKDRRSSATVDYITAQLETQEEELGRVEDELVRLQTQHPESIDPSTTARILIELQKSNELELQRLTLMRKTYEEVVGLLEAGVYDEVARLGVHLDEPIAQSYINEISTLRRELRTLDRPDMGAYRLMLRQRADAIQEQVEDLDLKVETLRGILVAFESGDESAVALFSSTDKMKTGVLADRFTSQYLDALGKLNAEKVTLGMEATDELPRMKYLTGAIAELRAQLEEHVRGRLASLEAQRDALAGLMQPRQEELDSYAGNEEEALNGVIAQLWGLATEAIKSRLTTIIAKERTLERNSDEFRQRLRELPGKGMLLSEPTMRRESLRESIAFLAGKLRQAQLAHLGTAVGAQLIDPALVPTSRSKPRMHFALIVGLTLGVLIGIALATARHMLRGKLYFDAELEQAARIPVLGSVPRHSRGRRAPYLALRADPDGVVAESYRSLRDRLRAALGLRDEPVALSVCSCFAGEGKTTLNANLAMAFALQGSRVLLVDGDMRAPAIHPLLEVEGKPGLAEALDGRSHWNQCVRESGFPNLDVLPAGEPYYSPGDMLSSPALETLLDETREYYDVVVLDLPQTLLYPDVAAVAPRLDAVLLLYRQEAGPSGKVLAGTADRLRQGGANIVGVVHNAVRRGEVGAPGRRRTA